VAELKEFRTREAAAEALADRIAARLRRCLHDAPAASLIVPGGRSPRGFLRALGNLRLPWDRVTVVPSDERWVDVESPDSNEHLIRTELLSREAASARFVSLYRRGLDPAGAVSQIGAALNAVKRPFDAVVLGLGADGHTASLFADAPTFDMLMTTAAPCAPVESPRLAELRLTLTPATLRDADEIDLLFFGDSKRAVYTEALTPGAVEQLPVRVIVGQSNVPVTSFWAR
jgi:6-phosphogluconolactonase